MLEDEGLGRSGLMLKSDVRDHTPSNLEKLHSFDHMKSLGN